VPGKQGAGRQGAVGRARARNWPTTSSWAEAGGGVTASQVVELEAVDGIPSRLASSRLLITLPWANWAESGDHGLIGGGAGGGRRDPLTTCVVALEDLVVVASSRIERAAGCLLPVLCPGSSCAIKTWILG
jgi:hypothetical protein